jgi:hypothetical protein
MCRTETIESGLAANEPFGRQPKPVSITLTGDLRDVEHYMQVLRRAAEHSGDNTSQLSDCEFTIYPRAVND